MDKENRKIFSEKVLWKEVLKIMKNPVVTVIMPCFNEPESYLRCAADSILSQTYKNLELLIILDNPSNEKLKKIGGGIGRK